MMRALKIRCNITVPNADTFIAQDNYYSFKNMSYIPVVIVIWFEMSFRLSFQNDPTAVRLHPRQLLFVGPRNILACFN